MACSEPGKYTKYFDIMARFELSEYAECLDFGYAKPCEYAKYLSFNTLSIII